MSKGTYAEALSTKAPKMGKKELRSIEIEKAENGGHIAQHRFESGDGPYHSPEQHVFGEDEGSKLLAHISKHLGIKAEAKAEGESEKHEAAEHE